MLIFKTMQEKSTVQHLGPLTVVVSGRFRAHRFPGKFIPLTGILLVLDILGANRYAHEQNRT